MSKLILLVFLLAMKGFSQESDVDILEKTAIQLNQIKTVLFQSTLDATESGITYEVNRDSIYFAFISGTKSFTPKYYIKNNESELIYDGNRHVQSLEKEKLIITNEKPYANNPLMLTLFPIRVLLPEILKNRNIEISRKNDTIIDSQEHYLFDLTYRNGIIDWDNVMLKDLAGAQNKYTLIINKSNFLPKQMVMENGPSGTLSRTYNHLDFDYVPDDEIWTGSHLPKDYTKMTFDEYFAKLISNRKSLATTGPNKTTEAKSFDSWKLPNLENDAMVNFSDFNGNVVLLEFWFKNCGPCIKAVPGLNSIHEKYKNDNFKLFGIEFLENFPKENLQFYISKIKMAYPTLYKGKDFADKYEISAAPTILLINKKGEIIYTKSGYDEVEVLRLIEENL